MTLKFNWETLDVISDLFDAYVDQHCTWGHLHNVLDDDNWERHDIEWCRDYSLENKNYAGAFLASILLQLNEETIALLKAKQDYGIKNALVHHLATTEEE